MCVHAIMAIMVCLSVLDRVALSADTAPDSAVSGDRNNAVEDSPEKRSYAYADNLEVLDGLRELRSLVNEALIRWIAGLYDPQTGGFYYSNSAKNTAGFYPDIESTSQAIGFLRDSLDVKRLPREMEKKLIEFFQERQDPNTGYFYDTQFGSQVNQAKKDRNLGAAVGKLAWLGAQPRYETPVEKALRIQNAAQPGASPLPPHFASKEAFLSYVHGLDWNRPYPTGNGLCAAYATIRKLGYQTALLDFLDATQNQTTGLWGKGCSYEEISGSMKLSIFYTSGSDRPYPQAEQMLESVISVMTQEAPPRTIVEIRNPFTLLNHALHCQKHGYSPSVDRTLRERLPDMVRLAIRNLERFQQDDHGYSYYRDRSSPTSQGARVSLGVPEGDLNGTMAGCVATIDLIHTLVGCDTPKFNQFQELFWQLLDDARPAEKQNVQAR